MNEKDYVIKSTKEKISFLILAYLLPPIGLIYANLAKENKVLRIIMKTIAIISLLILLSIVILIKTYPKLKYYIYVYLGIAFIYFIIILFANRKKDNKNNKDVKDNKKKFKKS